MALDLGKEPLGAAINAAQQGISGSHGFMAFFKNNAAIGEVVTILKNTQTLKPIRGLRPNRFTPTSPEFVCVQQSTSQRYNLPRDPYLNCAGSGFFAFWQRGYKWIFLCPKYFTLKISPIGPPSKFCPRVINNAFEPKGYLLADYQKYVLIHEMGHYYMGRSSLGWDTKPAEVYRLNECVSMDPKHSLKNPMHWQYFVASKFILIQL